MNMFLKLFLFAMCVWLVKSKERKFCPDDKELNPCTCDREGINCNWVLESSQIKQALKSFVSETKFRDFWLIESPVKTIESRTFGNYKFKALNLQNNQIASIHGEAFFGQEDFVEKINLAWNKLQSVPLESLKNLNYLKELGLNANQIKTIPEDAFANLPSLIEINLADNQIKTLGARSFNCPKLYSIDLNRNEIEILENSAFYKEYDEAYGWTLKLDENEIRSISGETFGGKAKIREIFLRGNKLESLNEKDFKILLDSLVDGDSGVMHLDGNPIQCNDKITWLRKLPEDIKQKIIGVECK